METSIFLQRKKNETDAQARTVCARCPVVITCRIYGDKAGAVGIWGGVNERERTRARNRMKRLVIG